MELLEADLSLLGEGLSCQFPDWVPIAGQPCTEQHGHWVRPLPRTAQVRASALTPRLLVIALSAATPPTSLLPPQCRRHPGHSPPLPLPAGSGWALDTPLAGDARVVTAGTRKGHIRRVPVKSKKQTLPASDAAFLRVRCLPGNYLGACANPASRAHCKSFYFSWR